jgi:hypothetical protein
MSVNGRFSRYNGESGTIVLGDGEDITLKLGVKEINTNHKLENVKITPTGSSLTLPLTPKGDGMWNIKHPEDVKENDYTVYHDIDFYYNGSVIPDSQLAGKTWTKVTVNRNSYYVLDTGITERRTDQYLSFSYTDDYGQYWEVYNPYSFNCVVFLAVRGISDIVTIEKGENQNHSEVYRGVFNNVILVRRAITPKPIPETEFYANPKWYAKLPDGTGYVINDTARYEVSPDTAVQSSKIEGYLEGSIVHNGTSQAFKIPVLVETRKCSSGSN